MKNGAVSYVTRDTAPFCYKAFATRHYKIFCVNGKYGIQV